MRKLSAKLVIVLLALLITPFVLWAQANAVKLADKFSLYYVEDSGSEIALEQVIDLPKSMYAKSTKRGHVPNSLDFSLWYRLELNPDQQPVTQPFTVTVDNPTLDYIEFFLIDNDQVVRTKLAGDTQLTESELDHVVPQFELFDGFDNSQFILVKVKTNGAAASPVIIEYATSSSLRNSGQLMLLGCYIGVSLIMLIYNYFMYRGTRDDSFIYYMGYIFFAGTTVTTINGFTFYVLPHELAVWLNSHILMSHFCGLAFAILFAISFLRLDKVKPWFVKLGENMARANFVIAISALYFSEATLTPIYFVMVGAVYLYALTLISMVFRVRKLWVKYYLLSWIPLFVGVGVSIAAFNGGVPYNFITRNGAMLGILAEICIMAIALLDRFRANEVDKEFRLHHDEVTGLPNQLLLQKVLSNLSRGRKPFTLALFDVPETKDLIPSLGVNTAKAFTVKLFQHVENYTDSLSSAYEFERNIQNKTYHVARVSDSSFAIIFVGDLSDEALTYSMISIQEAVSTVIDVNGASISATCFAGIVNYPHDTIDKENLVALAYQALIGGKKSELGWERYQDDKSQIVQERFRLASDLQAAVDNEELEMYHQPQIDLRTGEVKGSEVLLRWNHAEHGYIPADVMVTIAEETGIISQLTEWVIEKGLSQQAKLARLGFEHSVSINISQRNLNDNGLIAHILTTTAEYGVEPEKIIFEITESATVNDPDLANKVVTELYQQGYRIAIDDFGTGYSSLGYLSTLPFHEIKIDKCFMDINSSSRNRTITEVTTNLANRLGVEVVAEGVESEDVEEILRSFNCTTGQGYFYSKPMSFIEYMRWLQNNNKIDRIAG